MPLMKREWWILLGVVVLTVGLLWFARYERASRATSTEDPAVLEAAGRSPVGVLQVIPLVKSDLKRIQVAESVYLAEYDKIATVEELLARGLIERNQAGRPDYLYSCKGTEHGFSCSAHYIGTARPPYPDFTIDEHGEFHQVD